MALPQLPCTPLGSAAFCTGSETLRMKPNATFFDLHTLPITASSISMTAYLSYLPSVVPTTKVDVVNSDALPPVVLSTAGDELPILRLCGLSWLNVYGG